MQRWFLRLRGFVEPGVQLWISVVAMDHFWRIYGKTRI